MAAVTRGHAAGRHHQHHLQAASRQRGQDTTSGSASADCPGLVRVWRKTSLCHISSFFVFPSHEDTSKKWIFLQECCCPWPAVPPDWLLSACQLWCLLECFIHVVLLWNTSAEKKPYIARFWLANFSDLLLPVWQSQSKGQEKPWVAARGASPHYMLRGPAPISWDDPFCAALKHSFPNSWFHKVCIMKNKRKWTIENILNAAALW